MGDNKAVKNITREAVIDALIKADMQKALEDGEEHDIINPHLHEVLKSRWDSFDNSTNEELAEQYRKYFGDEVEMV